MAADNSFEALDGSQSSPAFAFVAAPTTGFYRDGLGIVATVAGVIAARITAAGVVGGAAPAAVTGAALAVTVNALSAVITTEALATAAGSTFAYVVTNSLITAASNVGVQVGYGSATAGILIVQKVVPAAGSVTITVLNLGGTLSPAAAAINGTLKIGILVS